MSYVYLLKSLKDGKQYIGSTNNLGKRFEQHNKGLVPSTKSRRPLKIVGFQKFDTIDEAALFEKKYKSSHSALERAIKNKAFTLVNQEDGV